MKTLRHMLIALAASLPCKPQKAAACDCGERFAAAAREWDEGLLRVMRSAGQRYSTQIGHA